MNLAVLLGAATTSAVLTGALMVGDSVRGSLEDLALDRLGRIQLAVLSEGFFRQEITAGLEGQVAPVLLLSGSAVHAVGRSRASDVSLLGIDESFETLYPTRGSSGERLLPSPRAGAIAPPVVVNESLRRQLGAALGDDVVLSFPRTGDAPADTVLGRRDVESTVGTLRCTIAGVVPDRGPGRFSLSPHQTLPLLAWLPLADLQRALGRPGKVNALLAAGGRLTREALDESLARALELEDLGMKVSIAAGHVSVESRDFILSTVAVERIEEAVDSLGGSSRPILTYLAIEMKAHGRSVPYSTITAVDPAGASSASFQWLELAGGGAAPSPGPDGILLNEWAAEDLGATPGDEVEVTYFVVGDRDRLRVETARLVLKGVVAFTGLAADSSLTPDYPGIEGARRIASWDPPFPVDFGRIRPRDEEYWERYGPTPKAFVSRATGDRLWASRYGATTALRAAPPAGEDPGRFGQRLAIEIARRIPAGEAGFQTRELRREGLEAARGATDFGALFVAFSSFLIVASALLCGLLFRLGVEQRAREIGVLIAVGYPLKRIHRMFLAEGLVLAAAGCAVGLAGAVAYAGLLMLGLRTIWREAVGTSHLYLHVEPITLAIGGALSIGIVALAVHSSVWRLGRHSVTALLGGRFGAHASARKGRGPAWLALGAMVTAAALLTYALVSGASSSPTISFGIGVAALVTGLALFSAWARGQVRGRTLAAGRAALGAMAARNCAWSPGRSLLSVALIGCACFVVVMVAAAGHGHSDDEGLEGGTGGYRLVAESDIPLHQDLETPEGRSELGITETLAAFEGVVVMPFRMVPGDDASCRNLHRPGRPRLLGIPDAQVRRGGFRFQSLARDAANPWTLLDEAIEPGVVPVFGDQNTVLWSLHLGLGRDLVVEDERGRPLRLRFVGLLDGSVFQSEILISERMLQEHFPGGTGYSYFLIDAPQERAPEIARLLESALGSHGFDAVQTADRLAEFRAVERTYLATFQMLGALGLLLGTVGLAVVMFRNVLERRGELAAMRAFGYARSRLGRMVLAENAFLLCSGIVVGTVAALAAVAPRLAVGDGLGAWRSILITLGSVLAVGMLSSLAAVAGALRAPLLPALKEDR